MLCKLWLDLRNLFKNNQETNMATVDSAVTDESTNSGSSTVVKKKNTFLRKIQNRTNRKTVKKTVLLYAI